MVTGRRRRREATKFWAHNAWMEATMRETSGTLPLFGLAGWTDLRMAGLWTFTDDWQAETTSLRHGDPHDVAAPNLLVATTQGDRGQLVEQLQLQHSMSGQPLDGDALAVRRRAADPVATSECEIVVDGRLRTFQVWQDAAGWQAACQLEERYAVVLDARHLSPADVTLVRVHDFEACLTDRRNWIHTYYDPRNPA